MDKFCGRARPYVKADLTGETGPAVALSHDDSPVLRNLGNGLLVAYIVDAGQSFEYIQNSHLSKADISEEEYKRRASYDFGKIVKKILGMETDHA